MDDSAKVTNGAAQYIALMDGIDGIESTLRALHKESTKAPDIRHRMMTVTTSQETYSSEGYKYFGIIVGEPQTLIISTFGMNYELPLDAGFNPITLLDGSTYSAAAQFPAVFVWTSVEIADTPIGTVGKYESVTLQDDARAAGNGTAFSVGGYSVLTFEISGTSTSRTIIFEGAGASGIFQAIQAVKLSDFSLATQTTGNSELWQVDVEGLHQFRARVSAVAGGGVTIKGRATA
jgi:hypothetical protein